MEILIDGWMYREQTLYCGHVMFGSAENKRPCTDCNAFQLQDKQK